MRNQTVLSSALRSLLVSGAGLLLLFWLSAPCSANSFPESLLLTHVQPVTGSCETSITRCEEIVRSTSEVGLLEFLLFFQPIYWQLMEEEVTIWRLHTTLTWPENWQLIEFDPCWGDGTLDPYGSEHDLVIEFGNWYWPCPDLPIGYHEVFLVARIVLDVGGPGRLDYYGFDNAVDLGCQGDYFTSYAYGMHAEAGVDCEYSRDTCLQHKCYPAFRDPDLYLTAPTGGVAQGRAMFSSYWCYYLTVDPRADWATATIEEIDVETSELVVTADATGLAPGTYETWIQVADDWVARCLHVVFTVEALTPAPATSWGSVKSIYR